VEVESHLENCSSQILDLIPRLNLSLGHKWNMLSIKVATKIICQVIRFIYIFFGTTAV
jgi:hypothetical protein